ncbi:MAG: methyltransferase domain-containing protein [Actinomycetota bacterium]
MSLDQEKVEQFVGQIVDDFGATVSSALAHIGHRMGLYRAMAGAGQLTSTELARRTGTHERYIREWLNNQAAGGYVDYFPDRGTYELPPEHAFVLANEDSPVFMGAGWDQMAAIWAVEPKLEEAFQSGQGVGWHEQDPRLFTATESFFKPAYRSGLIEEWIPALDGVEERLEKGGMVADVGCGHGASTILLAQAFPEAKLVGFDYHEDSIEAARRRAAEAGLDGDGQVEFEVSDAVGYPVPEEGGYDLICFFDAFHDFGDPVGAAAYARKALADDGAVMLVEIRSGDRTEQNLHPLGRLGYAMSTFVCVPNSLSQEVGYALGGQAGPSAIAEIFEEAGFTRFRQVAEAPVHQVLEARP